MRQLENVTKRAEAAHDGLSLANSKICELEQTMDAIKNSEQVAIQAALACENKLLEVRLLLCTHEFLCVKVMNEFAVCGA